MNMMPPFDPEAQQLEALAVKAELGAIQSAELVKRRNDVWRIQADSGTFFLKAYTKDWYGDDLVATSGCVVHELAAYQILETYGLPIPVLRWGDLNGDVVNRPALLLSALPGLPLTEALAKFPEDAAELLWQVGTFLRQMHTVTFLYPGYLMTLAGPVNAPELEAWHHPLWTLERMEQVALETLKEALPEALRQQLTRQFAGLALALAPAYNPPRFTHGDCHASQFFLSHGLQGWQVTGVLDLEVASAGAAEADFVQLALELRHGAADLAWWTPLFEGYGQPPDFERLRLWLLAASRASWEAHGPVAWPAPLIHTLAARTWADLFAPALP